MEFCKYGGNIEVLSPKEVRESVAAELRKALRSYKDII
jgi:predicted DNA-binding transcriptional regulator YafY